MQRLLLLLLKVVVKFWHFGYKCCCNGQWPLTSCYFKYCCSCISWWCSWKQHLQSTVHNWLQSKTWLNSSISLFDEKGHWLLTLSIGSKNVAFLLTERTSLINQMFTPKLIFLVGSSFWRACVMWTINYLINVDNWKMLARFIPSSFGIMLSMLNLMKEVELQRFIMLLTLINFLELAI